LETFSIIKSDNHLVIDLHGLKAILATGINTTFGNISVLNLFENKYSVSSEFMGVKIGDICKFTKIDNLDLVLGADVLSNYYLSIDYNEKKVVLSPSPFDFNGEELDINIFISIPIITLEIQGKTIESVFDTCSKFSYVNTIFYTGFDSQGKDTDFYPTAGQFNTDKYLFPIKILDNDLQLSFGKLPMAIQRIRNIQGNKGILGIELLKYFSIYFDFKKQKIKLRKL
jgi:hypothetical protein